jgi:hypothetical protein
MKKILPIIDLFCLFLIVSCTGTKLFNKPSYIKESNFSFYIEYGYCMIDKYDSYSGLFTKDMGCGAKPETAITFLSDAQIILIFNQMSNIKIFEYPDVLVNTPDIRQTQYSMRSNYFLSVINGQSQKVITWNTYVYTFLPDHIARYEALIKMIMGMLQLQPEIINLPSPKCGCA